MTLRIDNEFSSILTTSDKKYPLWKAEDLYKLACQAAMGNEHAITDEAGVRRWMERELSEMGEGPDEPLLESISPDGAVVRIHLRPLVNTKLNPEIVLQAFLDSAKFFRGSKENLEQYLNCALEVSSKGQIALPIEQLAVFFDQMRDLGFPAVHHSQAFELAYRPAYRVVARAALPMEVIKVHENSNRSIK